ncbi:MAG: TetR/AcrR family transcriptional regulator [Shewanella sp.]|nr:TetR/AcrR family transcriptional regulator [Shewanella sp.]MCF1429571.1 TetR/AcrR family transcriptional regulator [Shewanella sp.]MCF1437483.1 TetR/AcrR family transcriptional regulator [Shewanella sp.]MCF1457006.1 TetR/AcrR family transcriptional regulator [Shewanella sp.]
MTTVAIGRSAQKRQQILKSAIELFISQGLANTSMDEVARHAGVSKQTVYAHFGSKDELFVAAIESKCVVHQLSEDMLNDPSSPEQTLKEFARHFSEMIISPESMHVFKTCVSQADTHPEISRLFYDAGPAHVLSLLTGYLAQVEPLGNYSFGNCHHAAIRLCLMLFGEAKLRLEMGLDVHESEQERLEYVQDTAVMFLKAYRIQA